MQTLQKLQVIINSNSWICPERGVAVLSANKQWTHIYAEVAWLGSGEFH